MWQFCIAFKFTVAEAHLLTFRRKCYHQRVDSNFRVLHKCLPVMLVVILSPNTKITQASNRSVCSDPSSSLQTSWYDSCHFFLNLWNCDSFGVSSKSTWICRSNGSKARIGDFKVVLEPFHSSSEIPLRVIQLPRSRPLSYPTWIKPLRYLFNLHTATRQQAASLLDGDVPVWWVKGCEAAVFGIDQDLTTSLMFVVNRGR